MEKVIQENPGVIIKSEPEFVQLYSQETELSNPPQIIINQAWSINGVPSHFICIKNVKVTKDAIIIDVICDIEKNEDAVACQKTQKKVLDSSSLPQTRNFSGDPLKYEEEEEKFSISDNLKQEPNFDEAFEQKDFKEIGHFINIKSNDLPIQEETEVKRFKFFNCPECDERCLTSKHLKAHQKKIHERLETKRVFKSVPLLLQCGICDEKFDNEIILNLHMKSDHSKPHQRVLPPKENISKEKGSNTRSEETFGFRCKECDQKFTVKSLLKDHLLKDHRKTIKYQEVSCDICNKIFPRPSALKRHNAIAHEGRKDFQCDICSMQFTMRHGLNRHNENIHEKVIREKNHICELCGLRVEKRCLLTRHIKIVHEGLRPFICKTCGKTFKNGYKLKLHADKVHGDGTKFKCNICNKDIGRSDYLKQHIRTVHENRRDYKCPKCSKDFSTQSNLNNHLKTVHQNKD